MSLSRTAKIVRIVKTIFIALKDNREKNVTETSTNCIRYYSNPDLSDAEIKVWDKETKTRYVKGPQNLTIFAEIIIL